ncbi:MAG: hypothetical protein ABWW66_07210 [Archaeoglobaceae archaeon]
MRILAIFDDSDAGKIAVDVLEDLFKNGLRFDLYAVIIVKVPLLGGKKNYARAKVRADSIGESLKDMNLKELTVLMGKKDVSETLDVVIPHLVVLGVKNPKKYLKIAEKYPVVVCRERREKVDFYAVTRCRVCRTIQ